KDGLHVVADTLGSVGAVSAGLIMLSSGRYQADSLISMGIVVLIFYSSRRLILNSTNILLEGVPFHIDMSKLENRITSFKDVESVHNLHVWCISPNRMCCMNGHVVTRKEANRKS
ncbi:cation transporter, partial [Candidatus Bathyarchaeota archaeon]|nr:cation transporter [Candidatus Bathyarchaeota archaeon]